MLAPSSMRISMVFHIIDYEYSIYIKKDNFTELYTLM